MNNTNLKMSEPNSMLNIPFTRLKLRLISLDPIRLPHFPGSAFRGGFGAAFRRACCIIRQPTCRDCVLKKSCIYAMVFETASDHVSNGGYRLSDYPRPFIIEPQFPAPEMIRPGEAFGCHLVLLDRAIEYLPHFVYAFSEFGKDGIGEKRGRYNVEAVEASEDMGGAALFDGKRHQFLAPPPVRNTSDFFLADDMVSKLTLTFQTPTRVKNQIS